MVSAATIGLEAELHRASRRILLKRETRLVRTAWAILKTGCSQGEQHMHSACSPLNNAACRLYGSCSTCPQPAPRPGGLQVVSAMGRFLSVGRPAAPFPATR